MTTERMTAILNSVSQRVEKLVPSGRFYVVLYDPKKKELSFPLVRDGEKDLSSWDARPCGSEDTLPDLVIVKAKSVLYENDLLSRFENGEIHYWPDEKNIPRSWLGVPLVAGEQVLGSLVVESWQKTYSFNKNDETTLATVARQAAIALENVRIYEQLEIANEQLKRKIENLHVLNDVGQQLTRGLVKQEIEILSLVYESANKLKIDTRNMYVAFYDPDSNNPDTLNEIHGRLRFALAFENGLQSSMRDRVARKGLTEYIIRTKKSFNPANVQKAYQEYAPDSNGTPTPSRTRSWLGVPMLSKGQVFGVIVLRNYEFEQVYTEDDKEILELLAASAAVALENLKLYLELQKENEQTIAAERVSVMSLTAAEFVHKMNNLGGTIPVRVMLARAFLDEENEKDQKVIEQLDGIRNDTELMLQAAQEIQSSAKESAPEDVNVNELIEIAFRRALNLFPSANASLVKVNFLDHNIPKIGIARNTLLDTFTNVIKNGLDAIADTDKGIVMIETHFVDGTIEVVVQDTGKGISKSELPEIFKLFYTTKGPKGLGFGLWRDKTFIKRIGGDIEVSSQEGKGSVFTIKIPAKSNT